MLQARPIFRELYNLIWGQNLLLAIVFSRDEMLCCSAKMFFIEEKNLSSVRCFNDDNLILATFSKQKCSYTIALILEWESFLTDDNEDSSVLFAMVASVCTALLSVPHSDASWYIAFYPSGWQGKAKQSTSTTVNWTGTRRVRQVDMSEKTANHSG